MTTLCVLLLTSLVCLGSPDRFQVGLSPRPSAFDSLHLSGQPTVFVKEATPLSQNIVTFIFLYSRYEV